MTDFYDELYTYGPVFRAASKAKQAEFLDALPLYYQQRAAYLWELLGRDNQQVRRDQWYMRVWQCGRGYGKTRVATEHLRHWDRTCPDSFAVVIPTSGDFIRVWVDGPAGFKRWHADELDVDQGINRSSMIVRTKRGSTITFYSAEEPDRLRGPGVSKLILDEFASYRYAQEVLNNAERMLREGRNPQLIITTTPRPTKAMKEVIRRADEVVRGSSLENTYLPAEQRARYADGSNTREVRQEIFGELLEDKPGALWTFSQIDELRVNPADVPADLARVVIAVDPAASANQDSDETGIVAAARGTNKHYYAMGDYSLVAKPERWAAAAVRAYYENKADCIVAEVNNGGDMVEACIHAVDPNITVRKVHASRGKITRAEGVTVLYSRQLAHHVGVLAKLEDQMCNYEQGDPDSPDRMDALVWALTDLMQGQTNWLAQQAEE